MSDSKNTEAGQSASEPPQDEPAAANEPVEAAAEPADTSAPAERDYEAEIAELNDKLLRTLAEGENLRRRAQREREETAKFSIAGFARDVLGVGDNLRRALEALPEGSTGLDGPMKSFIEGVELTERELLGVLERHGMEKIDPAGQKFDHNLHEAMFEVPTTEAQPGTVVQVLESGYVLNGRLLRAARVGVAKHPPDAPPPPEGIDTTV